MHFDDSGLIIGRPSQGRVEPLSSRARGGLNSFLLLSDYAKIAKYMEYSGLQKKS